jgi:DNA-binding response OmpR family regulator
MRVSRTRGDVLPRTLSPRELEERLDTLLRRSGKETFNKLRDDVRTLAPKLAMQAKVPDR